MKTSIGKLTASILALALLLGAVGLFTQPTMANVDKAAPKRVAVPAFLKESTATTTLPVLTAAASATSVTDTTATAGSLPIGALDGLIGDGTVLTTPVSAGTADAGGSTTTLVDAALIASTVVIVGDWVRIDADVTGGAGASVGEIRKITVFTSGTGTITVGVAFSALPDAGDTFSVVTLDDDKYEDNWIEFLTGNVAGEAALIDGMDVDTGALTLSSSDGMGLSATPAVGSVYRIVETRPSSGTTLTISDSTTATVAAATYTVTVENDAVSFGPTEYTFTKTATEAIPAAGSPGAVAFDIAPRSAAATRTVAGTSTSSTGTTNITDTARTEAADYWIGRTITMTNNLASGQTRLITDSTAAGALTVSPAFTAVPTAGGGDTYIINIYEIPGFHEQVIDFTQGLFPRDVKVDNIGPIISSVTPSKGAVASDGTVVFAADVMDVFAGFTTDADDIDDQAAGAAPTDGRIVLEIAGAVVAGSDISFTKIDDGWNLSYAVSIGSTGTDQDVPWRIIARDRAGSQTIQDHTSSKNLLVVDGKDPEMTTSGASRDKNPLAALRTRTGDNWKASASTTTERWRLGPTGTAGVNKGGKSSRTGVLVVFDEKGGLDVDTVEPSDFLVNGLVPVSSVLVDVVEDSKAAPDSKKRRPQEVFLKMGSNLPSDGKDAAGDKIEVQLMGTVNDRAGNAAKLATACSGGCPIDDGIPAKLTVTVDTAYTQDDLVVTVASDETLASTPEISVTYQDTKAGALSSVSAAPIMTATGSRTYEVDVKFDDAGTVPVINEARKLNFRVTATDVNSNTDTEGETDAKDPDAVTAQVDPELNNSLDPEFTVAGKKIYDEKLQDANGTITGTDDADIESVSPLLITVDFSRQCGATAATGAVAGCADGGEKKEYQGDTHKTVTVTNEVVSVELSDGSKTKPEYTLSTADNIKFTIAISNPPIGDYTITLNAEDEAGNVSKTVAATVPDELESKFVVEAPDPVDIEMQPGWNLVSLPFQPANPSINSVLPASHPASLVMSYGNATGLWSVSRRDADTGLFTGDVAQMVATTAYFVFTDSLEPIEVLRPGLSTAAAAPAVPPAIAVSQGWNLVPVLSNEPDLDSLEGVSVDTYFGTLVAEGGSAGWLKALVWRTATQTWLSISPGGAAAANRCDVGEAAVTPQVCIGEGVWLWSTVDAVIIP